MKKTRIKKQKKSRKKIRNKHLRLKGGSGSTSGKWVRTL